MTKSSNLSLDHRGLETKYKTGTIPAQGQSSLTQLPTLTSQGTAGAPTANKLSGSALLHHRRAPFRSRGKSFCSTQYLTGEDSFEEMEDADQLKRKLSRSISQFPRILEHRNKLREIYLAQGERHSLEEGGNDKNASSRGGKSSHWPLRGHRTMVSAVELQQRESQDSDKLYPPDRNCLEDADDSEFEDRPSNSSIRKMLRNVNYRDRAHVYCKEWQSHESSERCRGRVSSVSCSQTSTAPNSSGSSAPSALRASANWSSATYSPQTQDLDVTSTLKMHTPLAFIRSRDNSSTSESFDSLHRLHNTPEDSTLREDSSNDSWNRNTSSPGGTLCGGETLQGSPRSSDLESSSPSVIQTRVTPDLHIACDLLDQLPLTFLAVPYLHKQSNTINDTTLSHSATREEVKRPWADREELKRHERG
ncbi:PREDICTED: uncharacterized protein LOC106896474 [Calidris pugnax]|uniref:uncharacterized protein LOC106896474 n=1 Tax=Calidris pugnax TaxID=198806 RepID=UPI00071D8012|nr:PREDICTED: uncharacterized protein LOC106896474 [Calidris pugnax]